MYLKSLSAQATTGVLVGGVVFVVLWLNLRLSLRLLRRREFAISTPEGPRVITVDTSRLRSLIYTAALGASVLAYICWNRGVAIVGANTAGFTLHLLPAFGTVLAILFLGESFAGFHAAGIAVILAGVVLATRRAT